MIETVELFPPFCNSSCTNRTMCARNKSWQNISGATQSHDTNIDKYLQSPHNHVVLHRESQRLASHPKGHGEHKVNELSQQDYTRP